MTGQLDTVMAACIDNPGSPHTPPGRPCRASFMLCLPAPAPAPCRSICPRRPSSTALSMPGAPR